jgi:hypothetical protein
MPDTKTKLNIVEYNIVDSSETLKPKTLLRKILALAENINTALNIRIRVIDSNNSLVSSFLSAKSFTVATNNNEFRRINAFSSIVKCFNSVAHDKLINSLKIKGIANVNSIAPNE